MKTVLITSPDPHILQSLQKALDSHYIVLTQQNPSQLYTSLVSNRIHYAILDDALGFPRIQDGIRLVRRLSPQTPIIVGSTKEDVQSVVRYMKAGASEILFKPWEAPVLLDRLETLSRSSRKKSLQSLNQMKNHLSQRVLNSRMTFNEALQAFENTMRNACHF